MILKACPFLFLHVPGFIEYTILISSWVHNKTWKGPKQKRTGLEHVKSSLKWLRIVFAASWITMEPHFWPLRNHPQQPGTGLFRRVPAGQKYGFVVFQEAANIVISRLRVFLRCSRRVLGCSGSFRVLVCTHLEFQIVPGCPKFSFRMFQESPNTFLGCFVDSY